MSLTEDRQRPSGRRDRRAPAWAYFRTPKLKAVP